MTTTTTTAVRRPTLFERMRAKFGWKALLLVAFGPVLTVFYYLPQWLPLFSSTTIPLTSIDKAVPFQPWWIWPYMSMYVMIPIPPLLATRGRDLARYALGMTIMFVTCCVFFFLWPIAYPRPPLLPGDSAPAFYRHIVSIDQPINALPSLHAGLTAYTLFFAARILRDLPRRPYLAMLTIGWVWAALILYGTMATKQHYLVDLPPGILIAWIGHWLVWRNAGVATAVTVAPGCEDA
jgi:hypothetical protein